MWGIANLKPRQHVAIHVEDDRSMCTQLGLEKWESSIPVPPVGEHGLLLQTREQECLVHVFHLHPRALMRLEDNDSVVDVGGAKLRHEVGPHEALRGGLRVLGPAAGATRIGLGNWFLLRLGHIGFRPGAAAAIARARAGRLRDVARVDAVRARRALHNWWCQLFGWGCRIDVDGRGARRRMLNVGPHRLRWGVRMLARTFYRVPCLRLVLARRDPLQPVQLHHKKKTRLTFMIELWKNRDSFPTMLPLAMASLLQCTSKPLLRGSGHNSATRV